MAKLPKRLSAGIEVAVDDLEKVERSKKYLVNMNRYHAPVNSYDQSAKCEVCFAGSVMAKTLGLKPTQEFLSNGDAEYLGGTPTFDEKTDQKLFALDQIRCGGVESAIDSWYDSKPPVDLFTDNDDHEDGVPSIKKAEVRRYLDVVDYDENPKLFKQTMRSFAKELRALGL